MENWLLYAKAKDKHKNSNSKTQTFQGQHGYKINTNMQQWLQVDV